MKEITITDISKGIEHIRQYYSGLCEDQYRVAHSNGTDGKLYEKLIHEEYKEWMNEEPGTPEDFKETIDMIIVILGYCKEQNYPLPEGLYEIHKEFLSKFYTEDGKFEPLYRDDGKVLKNTGFKKANFEQFFDKE